MNDSTLQYERITSLFSADNMIVDAAEVQGVLCGMLCGGMSSDDQNYLEALSDVVNQGDAFSNSVTSGIVELFNDTHQQFIEPDFALVLCLPDDNAPINDRGAALLKWVQGFLLGFGLHRADLTSTSDDIKEVLDDFSEIARMDEEMTQDEESEQALIEVMEYVRVTAMLCFNELGKSPLDTEQGKSVH